MKKPKLLIVRTIAVVCIGIGLYYLIKDYRAHFTFFKYFYDERYVFIWEHKGSALLVIFSSVILLLRPIAGFGLLRLKTWGRNLTIVVLSADVIVRAISFYNLHTFALRHPEWHKEMTMKIAEGAVIGEMISIVPSYFVATVSLVSVIILLMINWKEVRE